MHFPKNWDFACCRTINTLIQDRPLPGWSHISIWVGLITFNMTCHYRALHVFPVSPLDQSSSLCEPDTAGSQRCEPKHHRTPASFGWPRRFSSDCDEHCECDARAWSPAKHVVQVLWLTLLLLRLSAKVANSNHNQPIKSGSKKT